MDPEAEAKHTGTAARLQARRGEITGSNTGIATGVYCNLVVVPQEFAADFRQPCLRNPVCLPLLEQTDPGARKSKLAAGSDISTDIPRYNNYQDGKLHSAGVSNITAQWSDEHVGFLLGCSFTFEIGLAAADPRLTARNMAEGKAPPVYVTSVQLNPSGVFTGACMVVSMRWYRKDDIPRVRAVTARFSRQHGEPVAWGWEGAEYLGVADRLKAKAVDFGEWVEPVDGEVPVFWGCGVTGEIALRAAKIPGVSMTHYSGTMFVTDLTAEEVENRGPRLEPLSPAITEDARDNGLA
ncbi:hypothetical protein ASPVEDRAFT_32107 [Aspergillus versicolor CBS 583.65]|uniref:DUF1445 domain-containing protein n=1 Tax=Aspergillus versicolor CBS 583.65 TaxID=1036611 RepID=A0A1L9PW51_ASPVE|nr:uncharacterized protein ASPVEDRAFT_32107 [Aspergillus versicolor CBS 583.65]OJJ05748.1 hypothetical protein ASPVEDRAFT_32107 [Aspergillus versicolor CBS 583.65]